MIDITSAYKGKRVFVTGHTGFKGSWLSEWLMALGADVYGYSLAPATRPSLFALLRQSKRMKSHTLGDVRDLGALVLAIRRAHPDYIFHLAAQPLVRLSYEKPIETIETNVMGTANVLEAVRRTYGKLAPSNCAVVCVTTDKCYENRETTRPYREDDPMGGYDPYSCSKGCDELLISSYRRSFFPTAESAAWIASARAGNVIGGGDWSRDRLVPDCMRALEHGESIAVRNAASTRPWQHVLDPLYGYLALGAKLAARKDYDAVASSFNFGPDPKDVHTVKEVVSAILKLWPGRWVDRSNPRDVHEAAMLTLNIAKAKRVLGWTPRWDFKRAISETVAWHAKLQRGDDPVAFSRAQIKAYMETGK